MRLAILAALCLAMPLAAQAQDRRPSHCIAIAGGPERVRQAAWTDPVPERSVRLSYLGHSMFLIQTEGGLDIVTDYNGALPAGVPAPDVVTMNHAHSSHWTDAVEGIPHVLRGWSDQFGIAADHYLTLEDTLIRNVPTDIRSWGTVEENGNSIFVFEAGGLCIGHLGHLHHEPTDEQYAALGRVDVLLVPVDGSYTMEQAVMMRVVSRLNSSVVIPMHWFGPARLETFVAGMADQFDIQRPGGSEYLASLRGLPDRPTVVVLEPLSFGGRWR
ncbi:MBL fold metallo-hydrolase [Paracoccus benzoatiresistens]|uniref:MBL fold metallo-hydrolase n=1 Tax=Paracoccus benzoatiresistens TaxID=2997341 RepID=A0ABT4IZI5_9RHOB|nr:MBL fold metallo-hydrolase [Paracoccus sp. EF6]MCZ0960054.1 MBL fold metallo-hydrolase [Paracoccus sp. EF6]